MVMEPGSGLYCSAGRGNRRPFAARRRLPPVKDQLVGLELRYRDEGSRSRYFHRGIYFAQRARGMAQRNGQAAIDRRVRSEEHTSELQSLMRISYAVFCLKKKKTTNN